MTTSAQLNQARLSLQLQINQEIPKVAKLTEEINNGAAWPDIQAEWDASVNKTTSIENSLINLQVQNSGLTNDPDRLTVATALANNRAQVDALQADLSAIQPISYSNANIQSLAGNISKNSAGGQIAGQQLAGVPSANWTAPSLAGDAFNEGQDGPDVKQVLASSSKPSNAVQPTLAGPINAQLGTDNNTQTSSTVGGSTPTVSGRVTQNIAGSGRAVQVSNPDDAYQPPTNTTGNASNTVEGRTAIADEFLEKIVATPNKLARLASQTYSLSIYLMDTNEYNQLLSSDRKTLPTQQLLIQSGGAPIGKRNKYFDLDFYIEDLELKCMVGTQGVGSPHNAVTMKFSVLEPQGITFLERLRQAVWEHTGETSATINGQNYLLVIRFYGYDELGNLVSGKDLNLAEATSDPNALIEKFIPFQMANIRYKVSSEAVRYDVDAVIPQSQVGYSTARGTIPFNFQVVASDIDTLFNGDQKLTKQQSTAAAGGGKAAQTKTASKSNTRSSLSGATVTQGLVQALNQHQQELAKLNAYSVPDKYIIEIEDVPGLIDAKITKQGRVNKKRAPQIQNNNPNIINDPNRQQFDTESKNYSITAGTQIIQLIDQVMKNSTYVTAQQTIAFDEVTNQQIANVPVRTVQWYKITQIARPIGYDIKRGDYAYEIKYRISRYQINTPRSPYFPAAMYRGVHKVYEYWFTGLNTEVINFEIEANTNYISPIGNDGLVNVTNDPRFAEKRFFSAGPESSTQGGEGQSTRPAAQLAARLYGPADVAKNEIEIIGDPDWITQSELFYTTSNLASFEKDGSVNVNASEGLYEIRFNRVVDFDPANGTTPVFQNNSNSRITGETNLAQEALVFACYEVQNYFKQGKFTQRLRGTSRNFADALNAPPEVAKPVTKPAVTEPVKPTSKNTAPPQVTQTPQSTGARPATAIQSGGSQGEFGGSITTNADVLVKRPDLAEFVDSEFTGLPPVTPKPGSNTVSDDAGAETPEQVIERNNFAFSDDAA